METFDRIRVRSLPATAHFSQGSEVDVAFVLSCPGRREEHDRHPAAGTTGRNLERLLERLGPQLGLSNLSRSQITITNAWAGIEYLDKTGRSEASDGEVMQAENIDRLARELRHITMLIVFCGEKAKLACHELRARKCLPLSVQVAFVSHLGSQGLNKTIESDVTGRPIVAAREQRLAGRVDSLKAIQRENTVLRLQVAVDGLLASRASAR